MGLFKHYKVERTPRLKIEYAHNGIILTYDSTNSTCDVHLSRTYRGAGGGFSLGNIEVNQLDDLIEAARAIQFELRRA